MTISATAIQDIIEALASSHRGIRNDATYAELAAAAAMDVDDLRSQIEGDGEGAATPSVHTEEFRPPWKE